MWLSGSKSVGKLGLSIIGADYVASRMLLNTVDGVRRSTTAQKGIVGQLGNAGIKDGVSQELRIDLAPCRVF